MNADPAAVTAYIGIGANLGDAQASVVAALRQLARLPHSCMTAASSLYRSAPIDAGGDDYVNAVARLHTSLTPHALLAELQQLEQTHGRQRSYRNAPRTLDLDVLLYAEQIIHDDTLEIPHPRMTQRAFVLIPLLEIAPAASIPGAGPAQSWYAAVSNQVIELIAPERDQSAALPASESAPSSS